MAPPAGCWRRADLGFQKSQAPEFWNPRSRILEAKVKHEHQILLAEFWGTVKRLIADRQSREGEKMSIGSGTNHFFLARKLSRKLKIIRA